jgi:hypothetical protein
VKLPVLSKRVVWHVGNLTKRRRRVLASYEGAGLSVSEHPEEWTQIARLGGGRTYELRRRDGRPGIFLDMRRLGARRDGLLRQAEAEGLVTRARRWEFLYEDAETDKTNVMLLATEEEAMAELDAQDDGEIREVLVYAPTSLLQREWKKTFGAPLDDALAPDIAVLHVVEKDGSFDGAWWNDVLDPDNLSAPRGVIFPSRLAAWQHRVVP